MSDTDEQLEAWINAAWARILHSTAEADQREAAERMRDLVALRSPERVAQMEQDRGLR